MSARDDSPVLTDAEARVLCALSQRYRSIRRLARELGTTTTTIDRLVWRNRRVRPATIARIRARLRSAAAECLPVVHVCEVVQ